MYIVTHICYQLNNVGANKYRFDLIRFNLRYLYKKSGIQEVYCWTNNVKGFFKNLVT
jgi:hypothetical protein